MLTLQIQDCGATFFHPLQEAVLTIGSAPDADLCLSAEGVSPHHARITPLPGRSRAYKLVDLGSPAGTRVNGDAVMQVRLRLGDRIEIGKAVLVVGQQVRRRANAKDVLDERPAWTRSQPRRNSRWLAGTLVLGGLTVLITAWVVSRGSGPPRAYEEQARLRRAGSFDAARAALVLLRRDWAGDDRARMVLVEEAEARLTAVLEALGKLRSEVTADGATRSFAEQVDHLRALSAGNDAYAEAARLVLGEVPALRAAAPRAVTAKTEPATEPSRQPETPTAAAHPAPPDLVEPTRESVRALNAERRFAHALDTLQEALAAAPAAQADALRDQLSAQRALVRGELDKVLDQARSRSARGEFDEAIGFLLGQADHFPTSGPLAGLSREIESLEAEKVARTLSSSTGRQPSTPPTEPAARRSAAQQVAPLLEQIHAAEAANDLARAGDLALQAAAVVAPTDAEFERLLRGRSADFGHLAALTELLLQTVARDDPVSLTLRDGTATPVSTSAEQRLQVEVAGRARPLAWADIDPQSVYEFVATHGNDPAALIGAAILAYQSGEPAIAERSLAAAWTHAPSLQPAIAGVIGRARGDDPTARGYRLVEGKFVSLQRLDEAALATKLLPALTTALAGNPKNREAWLRDQLAAGPETAGAVLMALGQQQKNLAGKIAAHPLKKVWDKLDQERTALDEARTHALALIYDEDRYFYPYQPPAVSSAKAATYAEIQREVDERVKAVRTLWEDSRIQARVPKGLLEDVERFRWLTSVLADFGRKHPDVEADAAWATTLPADGLLHLASFCRTAAERTSADLWLRIAAFNEASGKTTQSAAEREQTAVTNAYRRMFGHRPVAINPKLTEAARGHSEEMATLGYFGHFSPTPQRRTPFERMRLSGYTTGSSENCAINGSAEGAHAAWLRSSGHHRNLLSPNHKEFGVGNSGNYWTQNFGSAEEFLRDPEFPPQRQ